MKKKKFDYLFLFSVVALLAIGLLMIFSTSPTLGIKLGDTYYFVKRHLLHLTLGLIALYYGFRIDLENLKSKANLIFTISLLLLLIIYIPGVGRSIGGAARWIDFGVITFQPSELMKFSTILWLSSLLCTRQEKLNDFCRGLLPLLSVVGAVILLIVMQPDLGTALVIAAIAFVLLYVAGAKRIQVFSLAALGFIGILILSITSAYRLRRLLAYLDPWKDPQGIGFQIIQSLMAVGSGGLWGLGLGASRQKYFYLPQQFTDFIFAILCEELGLIGGAGVAFLFILFVMRGFKIALGTPSCFHRLLSVGITFWITFQALTNIMVVIGLIPTTGLPLPFISFGGTAAIINLFAVGILLNISAKSQVVQS